MPGLSVCCASITPSSFKPIVREPNRPVPRPPSGSIQVQAVQGFLSKAGTGVCTLLASGQLLLLPGGAWAASSLPLPTPPAPHQYAETVQKAAESVQEGVERGAAAAKDAVESGIERSRDALKSTPSPQTLWDSLQEQVLPDVKEGLKKAVEGVSPPAYHTDPDKGVDTGRAGEAVKDKIKELGEGASKLIQGEGEGTAGQESKAPGTKLAEEVEKGADYCAKQEPCCPGAREGQAGEAAPGAPAPEVPPGSKMPGRSKEYPLWLQR